MSPRARFILRRLLLAIPVIVAMSIFVFLMIHLVPGDPVQTMLGFRATPQNVATVREQLGLDRPLLAQYLTWAGGLLHGNFGQDFISHTPVATLLRQRLPVTIELTLLSMTLAVLVGVPFGVRAAARPGAVRHLSEGWVVGGIAIADFWLGIMLVLLFAGIWQLLPPSGYVPFLKDPVQNLRYLTLPVLALAFGESAYILRTTRGAMDDVLGTQYILFLRAKGIAERRIVYRHALRNAAAPIVTVVGIQFGVLPGRRDRDRDALRVAGRRPADRLVDPAAQLRGRAGRRARRGGPVHPGHAADRRDRRLARPADRRGGGGVSLAVASAGPARRSIWRRGILSSRKGRVGFAILVGLLAVAVFAPLIAPHDPNAIDASRILAPPDLAHPFGSDALGRDVLSRVIYAYRVSLGVAVGSTLLAFLVGVPLGLYAGYHGGWVDTVDHAAHRHGARAARRCCSRSP